MSTQHQYFDLTTTGVAYVNRFRLNKPAQGNPYYSVTLAAMRGKPNGEGHIAKTYIDCNFVGDAVKMAQALEPYFEGDAEPSILVKFVAGDLELRPFEYKSGQRKGERGFSMKARLFDIKWFKVNGKVFYSEAERLRHQEMDQAQANAEHAETESEVSTQADPVNDIATEAPVDTVASEASSAPAELPREVKLSKDDPYFEEVKADLKHKGYRWNGESESWQLPVAV